MAFSYWISVALWAMSPTPDDEIYPPAFCQCVDVFYGCFHAGKQGTRFRLGISQYGKARHDAVGCLVIPRLRLRSSHAME